MNNTKDKILYAASQLFLNGGVSALSVRAIAREAQLSTIGIYSYFKGKQGILDALYIEGFEYALAATTVPLDKNDPKGVVVAATKCYVNMARTYQGHYRLIFGEMHESYQPSEAARKASENAFLHLIKVIELLLPAEASFEKKQQAALEIWALVHGYIGLQQHAIADVIETDRWDSLIIDAVSLHIDAMIKQHPPTSDF